MKYIKSLMLLAVAMPFFASCSDDDDVNTAECTVGFESAALTYSEATSDYVNIPIAVKGHRNGPVRVTIETAPYGESPAEEGVNYMITDKTLNLNADTLENGVINVEMKVIDDYIMNADRQFELTVKVADGAEITTDKTVVTLTDNDGDPYTAFEGRWYFNAIAINTQTGGQSEVRRAITITTADPSYTDYRQKLYCSAFNLCGQSETLSLNFNWQYDESSQTGILALEAAGNNRTVGNIQYDEETSLPMYVYLSPNGSSITTGYVTGQWQFTETGIPQSIELPSSYFTMVLADYTPLGGDYIGQLGYVGVFANITLTRE